ncbi:multidrug effflux MFS transporter [Nocardiopsis sp. CNT-189]|uniref:multidrug effflux MFS transporter n=1 Tax=Nocardiopsis oceanisediminis TaxID=2816862 RepID=UPI003B309281
MSRTSPPEPVASPAPAAPAPAQAGPRRTAVLVLVLATLTATGPLATDLYLPAFPQIAADLGAPEAQIQLTLTAIMLGLALGQLVIGPMSDAWGRRRPLLIGVAVFTLVSVACVFAPNAGVLVVLRFIQGMAGAAGAVISRAVVRDLFTGDEAARFFSRLMLITGLAPMLGPVLGGQLLLVGPWQLSFAVLAGVSALSFAAAFFGLPESLPADRRSPLRPGTLGATVWRLLRDARFIGPVLTLGLSFGAMFTYIGSFSTVSQSEVFGASAQQFSLMFAVNTLGIMIGTQVNARLIGRLETSRRLLVGLAVAGAAIAALAAMAVAGVAGTAGLYALTGVFFTMMFGMGFVFPNATTLALSSQPASVAGTASALMGSLQFVLGGGLSALAGLTASGQASLASMALVMSAGLAAGAAAFALSRRGAAAG